MKRLFHPGNTVTAATVFAGLLLTASSFTFGPTEDAQLAGDQPQKKVQRVKVIVNKDGKETKIDTTLNLFDGNKAQFKVDSILHELNIEELDAGNQAITIHRGGKQVKCTVTDNGKGESEEQVKIFIIKGDSGKFEKSGKVVALKGLRNYPNRVITLDDEFLPPPPPPGSPKAIMFHRQSDNDPYSFDTRDESVVSYEKKDIGDGLEKITIIRKKQDERKEKKEITVKTQVMTGTKAGPEQKK